MKELDKKLVLSLIKDIKDFLYSIRHGHNERASVQMLVLEVDIKEIEDALKETVEYKSL